MIQEIALLCGGPYYAGFLTMRGSLLCGDPYYAGLFCDTILTLTFLSGVISSKSTPTTKSHKIHIVENIPSFQNPLTDCKPVKWVSSYGLPKLRISTPHSSEPLHSKVLCGGPLLCGVDEFLLYGDEIGSRNPCIVRRSLVSYPLLSFEPFA